MANKPVYKNYQLYRTLPKLSGNMQLDLVVDVSGCKGYVQQAHLRPMSKQVNFVPVVDERIMDRPHHLNIKKFYEKTRSGFFEQSFAPVLKSDWPLLISEAEIPNLKYIKEFDDTYFAGCQRMSYKLYGCTHELLVPVWLDRCYGLKFTVYITNQTPGYTTYLNHTNNNKTPLFELEISKNSLQKPVTGRKFHNDFTKYLMDYFDYVKITSGSSDVLSVDFKQNISTISGLLVESGNYTVRQNLNVARNLIYRERPLLEANSLLTNTFMDYKMISTQLINFNLCFNFNDILKSRAARDGDSFERPNIWCEVDYIFPLQDDPTITWPDEPNFADSDKPGWRWEHLPLADFYTNHHYIPKQLATKDGVIDSYNDIVNYPRNALDYKRDFDCTDMIHQNKMSQSICHWYYAQQPEDMLFNVYNGFAAYAVGENGKISEYSHGYGAVTDPNVTAYDATLDNTIWAGTPQIHSDQTTANILNAPWDYVESGYFKDASNFVNGLKFTYNPGSMPFDSSDGRSAPSKVYMATATTPRDAGMFTWWTAQSNVLGDIFTVAILTDRDSSPTKLKDLPKTQGDEKTLKDIRRDWHMYSDMDNRYVAFKKAKPTLRAYFDPTETYLKKDEYVWLKEEDVLANRDITTAGDTSHNVWINDDHELVEPGTAGAVDIGGSYNGIITPSMLVRIGGTGDVDTSYRNEDNANGLFVTFLRTPINKQEPSKPNDPLFVIFSTKRSDRTTPVGTNIVYKAADPSAITLGGIREALRQYWIKYEPIAHMLDVIKATEKKAVITPTDLPDLKDFAVIVNIMADVESPEIIYFNNSITPVQDITLSINAKEHNFYKTSGINDYVWRYSGKIKPAIYPFQIGDDKFRMQRRNKMLEYHTYYGRNFIWHKTPIFPPYQVTPPNLTRYINKNVAPKYPSLDFEVVNPLTTNDENRPNLHGDLVYDEIPLIYLGKCEMLSDAGELVVCDKNRFSPGNFGFESDSFSLSISVLGLSKPYGLPTNDYAAAARDAVRKRKFDFNFLKNRTENHIAYWLYGDQYETYEWAEFKWFDCSFITKLPITYTMTGEVDYNDKESLEKRFFGELLEYIKSTSIKVGLDYPYRHLYDMTLLKNTYDLEYDLQRIEPAEKSTLYRYKYIVTATLK